jgi:hypothetical protein
MTARFLLTPGRIILSQPGFVVTTGMPDSQKIFDSNWNYSGVVLETGQAGGYGGQVVSTGGQTVINFKRDYGYQPCCFVTQFKDLGAWGPGWDFFYDESVCAPQLGKTSIVYTDRIELGFAFPFGTLRWWAYGVD